MIGWLTSRGAVLQAHYSIHESHDIEHKPITIIIVIG